MSESFDLYPKDLYPVQNTNMRAINWHSRQFQDFLPNKPLTLTPNGIGNFHLYHIAPEWDGMVLFGELDKIVPVSEQRFNHIAVEFGAQKSMRLNLLGVVGEVVTIAVLLENSLQYFSCTIGSSGSVLMVIPSGDCLFI